MLHLDTSGPLPALYLYGLVAEKAWYHDPGEVISADETLELLGQVPAEQELIVRINSGGGDVFQGVAIYNALAARGNVRVQIDALAASIASVIAMAGDQIHIAGNALIMVHRAWTLAWGNAEELGRTVETLKKVDETIIGTYAARCGDKCTRDQITAWLAAETWMDASEAVERGFADQSLELKGAPEPAEVPKGWYHHTPKHLVGDGPKLKTPPGRAFDRPRPDDRQQPGSPRQSASQIPAISAKLREMRAKLRV
jgi:ATP-dependent Clp protease protease subunit